MKYAIIQVGGKQFKISEGQSFRVERQGKLAIDVLAYFNGTETIVGAPVLKDVKLDASIVNNELGKKVRVVRFKAKSRYKKNKGFRQPYSIVKVESILKDGETKAEKTEKAEVKEEKKVKKAPVKRAKKEVK